MSKRRRPRTMRHIFWDSLDGWAKVLTSIGSALLFLVAAWHWGSDQIVWAGQFNQQMNTIDCRFNRLERVSLEGQLADVTYRISTYSVQRALTPDQAHDLAALTVRRDAIQRQLNVLGPQCDSPNASPRR